MTTLKSVKITCDGSPHTLAETLGDSAQAKFYQFLADQANADDVLIGGADVAANGFPLAPGAGYSPDTNSAEVMQFYSAAGIHFTGTSGDILYVLYPVG